MAPRTLHVIASRQPGGAEYFYSRLVNALNRSGLPTEVAVSTRCRFADRLDDSIIKHRVPMRGVWDVYSRWRINRITKQQQVDIVQTYLGRAARLVHPADSSVQLVCRVGGFYPQMQYQHAGHVICNSQGLCEHMVRGGIPADRIYRIPNFVDRPVLLPPGERSLLREKYGIGLDEFVICSVGRLHPVKGLDTLLEAFAKLRQGKMQRRFRLLLVGTGPQEEALRDLAGSLHVEQDIIWAGWQELPAPLYQISDLFVCASRQEGFGNVILEAWANRVAVVSTETEGPKELINHGETGMLTPINDSDAMADAILELEKNCGQRAQMVGRAEERLDADYSEAAVVGMYRDFYAAISR